MRNKEDVREGENKEKNGEFRVLAYGYGEVEDDPYSKKKECMYILMHLDSGPFTF